MSIIIIVFPGGPTPTPDAIKQEEELEDYLKTVIKGMPN